MTEQKTSEQEPADRPPLLIAGLGASAGGLEAFGRFFSAMPAESRTALVVVQHLDPQSRGLLTELLSKQTTMPVLEIQDGMRVEADHVYVAPPQVSVRIDQRILHLALLAKVDRRQAPVDFFFSSLAEDQRAAAVGIILSGEGTDGTLGLKAISDAGGITMVQDSASARYDSMPRNAAITGIADHVLPPEKMPEELLAYARHFQVVSAENRLAIQRQQIAEAIPAIAEILHAATRHDFQQYKTSTLVRRIERRMQVSRIAEVHRYVERLRQDREEAGLLFKELLIGVTALFRDGDAFAMLAEHVVPRLVENRGPGEQVRIWVPGCATGEEAYSIAILMREAMERLASPPDVQIFATDIDERALRVARQGTYPLSVAENVSPDRLARFFIRKGKRLHVVKELREMCLFSPHNLVSDPPFSRLDLISCRNLLIYLGPPLQKKLMSVFHYALRPGGYLLLGPSENVAFRAELFREVDAKQRLFQRKPTAVQSADVLTTSERSRGSFRPWDPGMRGEADASVVARAIVLEEYAPQFAVVNEEGQVVALSNDTSKYLQLAGGPFHNNIVRMARTGLRGGLRAALAEAAQTKRKALRENLFVRTDSGRQTVSLSAEPMPQVGDEAGLLLVIFRDTLPATAHGEAAIHPASEEVDSLIAQLEHELSTTRDELERSIQDLEAANEELKSSNEELLSMNEELQSANEELETSKEEIQAGSESLARAHSDLENLFNSTQIATIFLDDALTIRSFTPAVARIYNVIASDVDRPISDFTHRAMEMPPLPDPRTLRDTVEPVVDEIRGGDGQHYLRRVLPYRNHGGQAAGMVVTFVDITERKRAEAALEESEFRLRAALTAGAMGAWDWNIPTGRTVWSEGHHTILGYQVGEIEPSYQAWAARVHPDDLPGAAEAMCRASEQSTEYHHEYRVLWPDGSVHWVEGRGQHLYDERGQAVRMYGLIADVTERRRAAAAREWLASFPLLNPNPIVEMDLQGRVHFLNPAAARWFPDLEQRGSEHPCLTDWESVVLAFRQGVTSSSVREVTVGERWYQQALHYVEEIQRVRLYVLDSTERKRAEEETQRLLSAVQEEKDRLSALVNSINDEVWFADTQRRFILANPSAMREFKLGDVQTVDVEKFAAGLEVYRPDGTPRPPEEAPSLRALLGEVVNHQEEMVRTPVRGELRYRQVSSAPVRDAGGNIVGSVSVVRDITERKQAEAILLQKEAELREAQRVAHVGNWYWDAKTDVITGSDELLRIYGLDPTTQHMPTFSEQRGRCYPVEEWERLNDAVQKTTRTGVGYELDVQAIRHGTPIWITTRSEVVRDTNGQTLGLRGTVQDITERKRAEASVEAARYSAEQAKKAAEEASKAKDHFLAVLSHELRTPLSPVLVTAAMLQQDPRFDSNTREELEVIRRNAELEARLIDDLLDVTRIERGKVELNKQSVELCTIIKHAVEVCLPDIEARKLEFGVDIGPDAPYFLEADPARLQQVLWNLLKNAIKFTPVSGCVGIRCRRDGAGFVVIEVNDSGVGIEPDALDNIFNAFEQAERSITRQFGGLGLGLTISKAMVQMHGGTIEAHSPGKDQGSTFRVRLPLQAGQPDLVAPEGQPRTTATKQPAGQRRILLVEDHGDTLRIMKRMLAADGHEVETAADLATALKLAGERSFDLLISDLGLPDGSGLDLMRTLRARGSTLVGIALSGFGQQKDIQQSRDAGFAAHLTKPADYERLVNVIRELMG